MDELGNAGSSTTAKDLGETRQVGRLKAQDGEAGVRA